jgi:hypothetical protein
MEMKITVTMQTGWVWLYPQEPVFDHKNRIVGYTQRITDSNGKDEILQSAVRIVYN